MIKVNDESVEWTPQLTISELLKKLKYSFPLLVIKIDDELIVKENYNSTKIKDGADIKIIHLMSGG